jgi:LDH2 family malate/lactate/ureidoglycolate dehydrogenase
MHKKAQQFMKIFRTSGGLWSTSLLLDRAGIPALRLWPDLVVSAELLAEQVHSIFHAWGVSKSHAAIAVDHLLYADLHGIDSHGCGMLLQYHRDFTAGRLRVTPDVRLVRESLTTALVDGGGGLGHIAGNYAMKLAISKCREAGIGVVAVRNSNHYGAAGTYALMAARTGYIGISMTSTPHSAVVPTFGLQAMLGTNPISFAAPAGRNRPFLLDMATSTVPLGKLFTAWRNGNSVPEGWALDAKGNPITNSRRAAGLRRLTPLGSTREMGSHKGYGLAAMVEILSSILAYGKSGSDPVKPHRSVGHFFLALDPNQFLAEGEFEAGIDTLLDSLRAAESRNPAQPVMVAGDPEYAAYEERRRSGIPISRGIVEDIRLVCTASNVPFLLHKKD